MKLNWLKSSLLAGFVSISFFGPSIYLNHQNAQAETQTITETNGLINAGGKCLQADRTGAVTVWYCYGVRAQSWAYTQSHLQSLATSLCLSIDPNAMGVNGAGIGLAPCNLRAPAQIWTYRGNSTFINSGGKCLQINPSQIGVNGGQLQGWACNGKPEQMWTFTKYQINQ
jgi:hypothetical protein